MGQSQQVQVPRWIPKDRHEAFVNFAGTFVHLIPQLQLENDQMWASFMMSSQPEKDFPPQLMQRVSPF